LDIKQLEGHSKNIRKNIVNMLCEAGSGHPGGSLSSVDILTALYFTQMKFNPKNPKDENRDFFILSKGHGCPALYAVLAETGFFDAKELGTLRKQGSRLQGHPSSDKGLPGIEVSTGSLGYGLSIGVGIANGNRIQKKANRVYVLMGDGEQQEGSVWESAMSAGHFKLDNLCAVVDINGLQIDGEVKNIMDVQPLKQKYAAFGWNVIETDGHDLKKLVEVFETAKASKGKPTVILAKTVKGKGVSYMENVCDWHGKTPSREQADKAIQEIEK
jgi:transketolase